MRAGSGWELLERDPVGFLIGASKLLCAEVHNRADQSHLESVAALVEEAIDAIEGKED